MAHDGNEAWQVLGADDPPRLAVLDWMMPGMDGVELCRRVRAANREPYIYIVLLTGRTESQDLIEGMDAGADDYLTKPFNAHELRVRIRAGRRILDLQDALRLQATHDGLTGFLNRNSILEKLEEELARSLSNYYAESGIELIPFLRDQKDWDQLMDVLEEYARIAPAGAPLNVQLLKEMEALLNE